MGKKSLVDLPELVFAGPGRKDFIYRNVRAGRLRRLAIRLYTSNMQDEDADIVRRNLWQIVSGYFPGGLICDRTGLEAGAARDGSICLIAARTSPISLPGGFVLRPRRGHEPLSTDLPFIGSLRISSTARSCLENMRPTRSRGGMLPRTFTQQEMIAWLASFAGLRGAAEAGKLLAETAAIAEKLDMASEAKRLAQILEGIHQAATGKGAMPARQRRKYWARDLRRVESFGLLYRHLRNCAPPDLSVRRADSQSLKHKAFFEAYFSNYIEGTEFSVRQAADIAFRGRMPADRRKDAHDIMGTWSIVSSSTQMRRTPRTFDQLIDLLCRRHETIMQMRPEAGPGRFKAEPSQAGAIVFVAPELVIGTLHAGYEMYRSLESPFARAAFIMYLVSEVHPFADGNGRIARIMMNAELVAGDAERIIIPTVYRGNYLAALRALSAGDRADALVRTLSFAQRWVASIDWSSWDAAHEQIDASNAFLTEYEAEEQTRPRLVIAPERS